MPANDPIVLPVRHSRTPNLGPVAVIAATGDDLRRLHGLLDLPDTRKLYMSRLFYHQSEPSCPSLIGPVLGAPYAVMLLETLRAWGVRTFVFAGWCGSIHEDVTIGALLLPTAAIIDEGTSLHYGQRHGNQVVPDETVRPLAVETLDAQGVEFKQGTVWTTDGVFRETPSKIRAFRDKGAVAVEMEFSALLSAAVFYRLSLTGVMVVSDELFTGKWRPGFKENAFSLARDRMIRGVAALVEKMK